MNAQRLYELLPALHRARDAEQGGPLKALIALFAREIEAIEENLDQLYDDQFIETCDDWVAPYIGDLIGYRPLHGGASEVASPRAEVANTIRFRRRKGTALMLEELARSLSGAPARAVEFFEQLATTQYMKHLRPHALASANLRSLPALLTRGGPFNRVAHTAEMRRPEAGAGRYNIPNIGLFLWRLRAWPLSQLPLSPQAGDASGRKFRVNPLGADLRLFRRPLTEASITHIAEPINVPAPLTVREMALAIRAAQASVIPAPDARDDDDYGPDESLVLWRAGAAPGSWQPLPVAQIVVCDLRDMLDAGGNVTGWNHETTLAAPAHANHVGIDPERGRVLLGSGIAGQPIAASFHYGFSRDIGGGEYQRTPAEAEPLALERQAHGAQPLQPHLDAIAAAGGRLSIEDSLRYAQSPVFKVADAASATAPGHRVVVAASNGARPLIAATGDIALQIGSRGTLVLDGLAIAGGTLRLPAAADDERRDLLLRDCTLLPGLALNEDGSAVSPGAPSLVVAHPFARVRLERCIVGALQVVADAEVELQDCIVDAGARGSAAFAGIAAGSAGAQLTVDGSTIVGCVHARVIAHASDTIFFAALAPGDTARAAVWSQRTQQGCVRYCWLPLDSIAPRRFRCLPDARRPDLLPHFTSLRYGDAGYAQLRSATALAIRTGASDEGEIGVMHALAQPQREANLRIRLDEYLRFGLRAGLFHAS